jgi:enamine deaminase RidA (YjgF/YER057c/UK114 family)
MCPRAPCRETKEIGVAETVKYYPLVVAGVERSHPNVKAGDGKYAAAMVVGNLVFLSGMTAESEADGTCLGSTIEEQVEAALEKVRRHLEEVGSSLENVVKDLIILKDMEHYHGMRATELAYYQKYAPRLVKEPPASTIFQPAALGRPEFLVEWEVVAVVSREA